MAFGGCQTGAASSGAGAPMPLLSLMAAALILRRR
ncbi:MYXO-CTERM sorting domain-containing protein [Actinomyces bouchesdurhonensis]